MRASIVSSDWLVGIRTSIIVEPCNETLCLISLNAINYFEKVEKNHLININKISMIMMIIFHYFSAIMWNKQFYSSLRQVIFLITVKVFFFLKDYNYLNSEYYFTCIYDISKFHFLSIYSVAWLNDFNTL